EQGAAGVGLSSAGSTLDATQALAGARIERGWWLGAARLSEEGRLARPHAQSQAGSASDARDIGRDVWSPIAGSGLDDETTVFGLGLGLALPDAGRFGFDIDTRHVGGRSYTGAFANWTVGFRGRA